MLKFYIFAAALLPAIYADWCELENCQDREHLDCTMGDGEMGDACPDGAVMLNLAPAQTAILNAHNTYRNQVAGGRLKNKFAATRMGTMRWNVSFANLGRRNVKKCDFTQDACVNTPDFDFVGQNIARAVYPTTDKRSNLDVILDLIKVWFDENADAKMADIRQFPEPPADGPVIANFCQMVRDYSTRVGCGAITWTEESNKVIQLTCHYDLANVLGWPVYDNGPAASKCKSGKNPQFPNLCSANEVYNVNTFFDDDHYE